MLPNTRKLAGCTLFITGASRGIGKAIALKAARDGANIVIAAKTATAHPTLPGTIYTAAKEIEEAGGKALPCIVDVRDEQQVATAVENAVHTFGGIDILVNNASAISLTGTLETSMKKVDLMTGINLRGTYLTSKVCIPYLKKSKNPHILNISPPINMNPVWFKNHCAYTMAKYGMSMCVLGMAEEFRSEIAVNALWPKTAIHTAAMEMLAGSGMANQCRKPDIMADAAYAILCKPTSFTGNFVIDEDILMKEGITNLDIYHMSPGHPLLPDFFLDEEPEDLVKKMEEYGGKPAFRAGTSAGGEAGKHEGPAPIGKTFERIRHFLSADVVKSTGGIFQFDLSGEHASTWYLDLKNGAGAAGHGPSPDKADVVMSLDSGDFVSMFAGKIKPTMAFMSGKLKIKGDMGMALKLEKLMSQMKSKL
ncbi:hydroxysteroid dehydrogenase-like protein 2 [Lampetra fluviatilis]